MIIQAPSSALQEREPHGSLFLCTETAPQIHYQLASFMLENADLIKHPVIFLGRFSCESLETYYPATETDETRHVDVIFEPGDSKRPIHDAFIHSHYPYISTWHLRSFNVQPRGEIAVRDDVLQVLPKRFTLSSRLPTEKAAVECSQQDLEDTLHFISVILRSQKLRLQIEHIRRKRLLAAQQLAELLETGQLDKHRDSDSSLKSYPCWPKDQSGLGKILTTLAADVARGFPPMARKSKPGT